MVLEKIRGEISLKRYLSSYTLLHVFANRFRIVGVVCLQEHQFGNCCFNGGIATADNTSLLQMVSVVVAAHLNGTLHTLTDVHDYLTIAGSLT